MSVVGIILDGAELTTMAVMNVSGSDGATGFFFLNGWSTHLGPGIHNVRPGWTVVGNPTWVVTAVDSVTETITISNGTFISGQSYQFVGPGGMTIEGGVTIRPV